MLYLDFETRSAANLKKVGLENYLLHPTTSVLCCSYAVDSNPVQLWQSDSNEEFPNYLFDNNPICCAHNYRFEQLVLQIFFGSRVPLSRWVCTMALSRSYCLPGSLAAMGKFLKFPKLEQRALKKLSRPRSTKGGNLTWWEYEDAPNDFETLYKYCKTDTEISRKIRTLLGDMDPRERNIWGVTRKLNNRGFAIDADLIPAAQAELARERRELNTELGELTGGLGVDQTVALAKWAGMPSVDKEHIRDALASDALEKDVRRALEIRKTLGQKSVAKLKTVVPLLTKDNRIKDSIPYAAAEKTKRWAGRGFQPQNLTRGSEEDVDPTIERMLAGEPLDHPHDEISNCMKRFIIGPFYAGDYSQIEARTLAWIAEEHELLDAFRKGLDPYKIMAAETYKIPVSKVTKDQRFMGKQQILSLGYGAGAVGFKTMLAKIYDVHISPAESQNFVDIYRKKYRKIVKLWYQVDKAFKYVIRTRKILGNDYFSIEPFAKKGIAIRLPSGSRIYYHRASVINGNIVFYGRIAGQNWGLIKTYGAKIVENIVQSIARDIIADAIIRLRKWPLVLLVHDEVVSEVYRTLQEFIDLMEQVPKWATGLPIAVEAKQIDRYHK